MKNMVVIRLRIAIIAIGIVALAYAILVLYGAYDLGEKMKDFNL